MGQEADAPGPEPISQLLAEWANHDLVRRDRGSRETSGTCDIRASAKPLTERFEHSSSASARDLPPVVGIHRDRGMRMAELIGCCP